MAEHERNFGVGGLDSLDPEKCIFTLQQMASEGHALGHSDAHTAMLGALAVRDRRIDGGDGLSRNVSRIVYDNKKGRYTYVDEVTIVGADAVPRLAVDSKSENVFILGNDLGHRSSVDRRRVLAVGLERRTQYVLNSRHGADILALSRTVDIDGKYTKRSIDWFTTTYGRGGNSSPEYLRRAGYIVKDGNRVIRRYGALTHPSVRFGKPNILELASFLVLVGLEFDT